MKDDIFILILILSIFVACTQNNVEIDGGVIHFVNDKPRFDKKPFVELEKLYDISNRTSNYYIVEPRYFDVDSDTSLYVLEPFENCVYVFNSKGSFIRKMGETGDGPSELRNSRFINIVDDIIYITEKNKGVKVWDLNGKYIDYIVGNKTLAKSIIYMDSIFGLKVTGRKENGEDIIGFEIGKYTKEFEKINRILHVEFEESKRKGYFPLFIPVNSKGDVFFPADRDKYIIKKYDTNGKIIKSFGREYKRKPHSEKYKKLFNERKKYNPGLKYHKHPSIINGIFIDNNDLVWVAVGEWGEGEIDLFNSDGKLLYSFICPFISGTAIFRYNRLYSIKTVDEENKIITVFQLKYNFDVQNW
ncbi:6-bladed beta-propeller [candidate division KSB1 bacterium]